MKTIASAEGDQKILFSPGSSLCILLMPSFSANGVCKNILLSSEVPMEDDEDGGGAARVEDRVMASFKILSASFQCTPLKQNKVS